MHVAGTSTTSVPIGLPATPRALRHTRYLSGGSNEIEDIPAVPTIPTEHQPTPEDDLGPLLPATTFGQAFGPTRSASAPPEDISPATMSPITKPRISPTFPQGRRASLNGRGHLRTNTSPDLTSPSITASIDETIHEHQVVILEQDPAAPPLLNELQHLATPPPPPPAPLFGDSPLSKSNIGLINIAIDGKSSDKPQDAVSPVGGPSASSSTTSHRRGRGSVSENLGMTFKRVTERMRSTSRSRNKSPPTVRPDISPYESIPPFSFPRSAGGMSPIEGKEMPFGKFSPPPPQSQAMDYVGTPTDEMRNPQFAGYRHPREIRANMPPEQLQQGVFGAAGSPMI
jgi:hypothetical protein